MIDKRMKSYYNAKCTKSYSLYKVCGRIISYSLLVCVPKHTRGIKMNQYDKGVLKKINYLCSEIDSLYHQASLKLGISDSVSIILYTVHDEGGSCLLSDIYKKSGISKQTVNSAIRGLEADGIIYLEQHTGRAKRVVLTDRGKTFTKKTVGRLQEAEIRAFDTWSEEEISSYIHLMEKYTQCFREQIEKM